MAESAHKIEVRRETRDGGVVAHLVFDNARRLNVLNPPALHDLTATFHALSAEENLRVVVFSGAGGRAFIGGADINHMAGMRTSEDGRAFITMVHKLCQSIRDCPVPVICRMEGYTLGGPRPAGRPGACRGRGFARWGATPPGPAPEGGPPCPLPTPPNRALF